MVKFKMNAKNMAEETARKVDGVTNVKNNLSVVNSMRNKMPMDNSVMARPRLQNDEAIKENLLRALKNEGALQNAQVSLDVNQGVALFSGNANTFQEVDRILAIALNMDGIRDVQSSMTVQGSKY